MAYLTEKPNLRPTKTRRHGRRGSFTKFATAATVKKSLVAVVGGPERPTKKALRNPMLLRSDNSILDYRQMEMSVNRQKRWEKVTRLQTDISSTFDNLTDERVSVHAIEMVRNGGSRQHVQKTVAHHVMNEDGTTVSRLARRPHGLNNGATLVDEARPSKKERRRQALANSDTALEATVKTDTHSYQIRYNIVKGYQSEKLWDAEYLKSAFTRRYSRDFPARKQASIDDHLHWQECMDDSSNDDCYKSDHSPIAVTREQVESEYALADFVVQKTDKKQRRAKRAASSSDDGFEIVDGMDVLSLDSSESDEDYPSSSSQHNGTAADPPPPAIVLNLPATSQPFAECIHLTRRVFAPVEEDFDNYIRSPHQQLSVKGKGLSVIPAKFYFDFTNLLDNGARNGEDEFFPLLTAVFDAFTDQGCNVTVNSEQEGEKIYPSLKAYLLSEKYCELTELFAGLAKIHNCKNASTPSTSSLNRKPIAQHSSAARSEPAYKLFPAHLASSCNVIDMKALMRSGAAEGAPANSLSETTDLLEAHCCSESVDENNSECGICFYDGLLDGFSLSACGHYFCADCWKMHIRQRLISGMAPILCPHSSCKQAIPTELVFAVLPLKLCHLYQKMVMNKEVIRLIPSSARLAYCPGCSSPICIQACSDEKDCGISQCTVCRIGWCVECTAPAHWPLNCQQATVYFKRFNEQSHFFIWQTQGQKEHFVKVKRCPKCPLLMERASGCDHMACRCGTQFCWACLGTFTAIYNHTCAKRHDNFKSVQLVDVRKIDLQNKMAKAYFEKCGEFRERRFSVGAKAQLIKRLSKIGIEQREREELSSLRITALHLLEHSFAYLYVNEKGSKKFNQLVTLCDRLKFVLNQVEWSQLDSEMRRNCAELKKLIDMLIKSLWRFKAELACQKYVYED